jgi:hypothetical protein
MQCVVLAMFYTARCSGISRTRQQTGCLATPNTDLAHVYSLTPRIYQAPDVFYLEQNKPNCNTSYFLSRH